MKKIIHIDMDAFYTSIEQRDHPELRGRPVVVGGDPHSRGVVASASYEARKFGIRSAMSCARAYRLCPQTVFVPPHFDKYVEASRKIRAIFESITPLVEPLSLDEAYLDVTENAMNEPVAKKIAIWIKNKIRDELGLIASAGVGPNKFIAKLASDFRKPDGLVVVAPDRVGAFIEKLPVERFWGVGPATAKKLSSSGITNAVDLREAGVEKLEEILGSYGRFLFDLAHGRDDRTVEPDGEAKSRGSETTFDKDITDTQILMDYIVNLAEEVAQDLKKSGQMARTVTVKIKYSDFKSITRSRTFIDPTDDASFIARVAGELLFRDTEVGVRPVRLLGVSTSGFALPDEWLQLWFRF